MKRRALKEQSVKERLAVIRMQKLKDAQTRLVDMEKADVKQDPIVDKAEDEEEEKDSEDKSNPTERAASPLSQATMLTADIMEELSDTPRRSSSLGLARRRAMKAQDAEDKASASKRPWPP